MIDTSPLAVRDNLKSALTRAWSEVERTGAWLSGEQRLAIANEARNAWQCELCQRRKEALSPYTVKGDHEHLGVLPDAWVEAVHRIVTDSGRITESWYDSIIASGIPEDEFIELLSLVAIVTGADTFMRGIGLPPLVLPATGERGTPPRRRPGGAKTGPGWAPTVAPEDAGAELSDFYETGPAAYVRRALTLVPDEANRFWLLLNQFYLSNPLRVELDGVDRAISRAQMEFIATRTSAWLDCFY